MCRVLEYHDVYTRGETFCDSIESLALIADLEFFKKGNKVDCFFSVLNAECHLKLTNMSSPISLEQLSMHVNFVSIHVKSFTDICIELWEKEMLLSLLFSVKSVKGAYITCSENMKAQ
jgi:hypothetical protein